jgi:hypothetical protein
MKLAVPDENGLFDLEGVITIIENTSRYVVGVEIVTPDLALSVSHDYFKKQTSILTAVADGK